MTVGGIAGTLIGLATVNQIQATSPLTHNISGTAKAAAQTILAFLFYKNPATVMGCTGIAVVLGGSLAYARVRLHSLTCTPHRTRSHIPHPELSSPPFFTLVLHCCHTVVTLVLHCSTLLTLFLHRCACWSRRRTVRGRLWRRPNRKPWKWCTHYTCVKSRRQHEIR
jgi:hypothetical protein